MTNAIAMAAALSLVLSLANLLLWLGVIRRLRTISTPPGGPTPAGYGLPPVGHQISLTSKEIAGRCDPPLDDKLLKSGYLAAFVSKGCQPCDEQQPQLLKLASELAGRVVVFVVPGPDDGQHHQQFAGRASVVRLAPGDVITDAFQVTGTPAFVVVRGGKVAAAGRTTAAVKPAVLTMGRAGA